MTWKQLIAGSGGITYTQTATPDDPERGDTWYDESAAEGSRLRVYADIGNGAEWVVLPTLLQSDILSDEQPFPGENVDAAVSSRSSHDDPDPQGWLDAPVSEAGATQSDIASGVDQSSLAEDARSGRTRELLLLLQDAPVPEVVDPMAVPSGGRVATAQSGGDQTLGGTDMHVYEWDGSGSWPLTHTINASNYGRITVYGSDTTSAITEDGTVTITDTTHDVQIATNTGGGGTSVESTYDVSSYTGDLTIEWTESGSGGGPTGAWIKTSQALGGYVTDQFGAPTSEPADFTQWNTIRAMDVTTGGSTSANPVEFEILDSTDTTLNSSRIPKSRIADSAFKMRGRIYSGTAGSDGDGTYIISTTGQAGHFGIPILTVVSVKKNGSLVDESNWLFDGDDTVIVDTANVTINAGDTIEVEYDFDIFDSTLQPRAHLNREATSETSPSISHFRYEYIV